MEMHTLAYQRQPGSVACQILRGPVTQGRLPLQRMREEPIGAFCVPKSIPKVRYRAERKDNHSDLLRYRMPNDIQVRGTLVRHKGPD